MAADRFYFWRGYYNALAMLPTDEQRGQFVMAMCEYAFDGTEPELSDPMQQIAWAVIEEQVRESVEIGRKQSERGKKGGRPRKSAKKSGAKTTALSGVKSGVESTAESVRYGKVPIATGAPLESRPRDEERYGIDFDNLPPME